PPPAPRGAAPEGAGDVQRFEACPITYPVPENKSRTYESIRSRLRMLRERREWLPNIWGDNGARGFRVPANQGRGRARGGSGEGFRRADARCGRPKAAARCRPAYRSAWSRA